MFERYRYLAPSDIRRPVREFKRRSSLKDERKLEETVAEPPSIRAAGSCHQAAQKSLRGLGPSGEKLEAGKNKDGRDGQGEGGAMGERESA